ncbi:uncharacterized protein A4U43_C05F35810 [Asparagus officinalis]|uniref:Uncharacterized protein n=1 Tax=Asparagus officinalis TaxID=4686 RepID=A0A5P1EZR5_ASPOF|nr:uncharacterized protein A4U43_C05F35810 [Asparagus officinalis]
MGCGEIKPNNHERFGWKSGASPRNRTKSYRLIKIYKNLASSAETLLILYQPTKGIIVRVNLNNFESSCKIKVEKEKHTRFDKPSACKLRTKRVAYQPYGLRSSLNPALIRIAIASMQSNPSETPTIPTPPLPRFSAPTDPASSSPAPCHLPNPDPELLSRFSAPTIPTPPLPRFSAPTDPASSSRDLESLSLNTATACFLSFSCSPSSRATVSDLQEEIHTRSNRGSLYLGRYCDLVGKAHTQADNSIDLSTHSGNAIGGTAENNITVERMSLVTLRYVKTVPLAAELLDVRRHQKLEMLKTLRIERGRFQLEVEIGKSPPLSEEEVWLELRQKAIELRDEWRLENRRAFANIWSDMVYGISLFILIYLNKSKVALLKFTGYKLLNNISDTGKAFLIILITDIFLGYHSESGWQALVEIILDHYGLQVDPRFCICSSSWRPTVVSNEGVLTVEELRKSLLGVETGRVSLWYRTCDDFKQASSVLSFGEET